MPTYHYRCKSCKHEFEEFQKMADDSLVVCPSCKKHTLNRVISGSGLVFKGSGFYITDYKGKSPSHQKKEEKVDTTPKSETKSESKPETKPAESSKSSDKSTNKN